MIPATFPEANAHFGPPPGLSESQVQSVVAWAGNVEGGSMDGSPIVVTAWKPTPEELALLAAGKPIFLTFVGGLPPHMISMDFHYASHPA